MCEYCGCRDIPLIGRLSEEHYAAVDGLGVLKRAIDSGDAAAVADASARFAAELFEHNDSEEAGLFHELAEDEYFAPTVAELMEQHRQFRELVARIDAGDWAAYPALEDVLRHHIDREENGLFPATAVAVDGDVWAEIDRRTHDFNHAHHREHAHTEAELHDLAHGGPGHGAPVHPEPVRTEPVVRLPTREFTVRRAAVTDAADLLALWKQAGLVIRRPGRVAEDLASVLSLHPELVLVAEVGESIVGCVIGTWDGRRGWINRLATRRDWRGRGVASALLAEVEAGIREIGGTKVNLLLNADDYDLVGYYEGHGYATNDLIFMEKFL